MWKGTGGVGRDNKKDGKNMHALIIKPIPVYS